jgi:hypothetical protein
MDKIIVSVSARMIRTTVGGSHAMIAIATATTGGYIVGNIVPFSWGQYVFWMAC